MNDMAHGQHSLKTVSAGSAVGTRRTPPPSRAVEKMEPTRLIVFGHDLLGQRDPEEQDDSCGEARISCLAASGATTLCIYLNGSVRGWGPLGKQLLKLRGVVAVACGGQHALALLSEGHVVGWGSNEHGQLGTEPCDRVQQEALAVKGVVATPRVGSLSAGESHSLAIGHDGQLYSWGRGDYGQLGRLRQKNSVAAVEGGIGWSLVAAGCHHSAALREDGCLFTFGWDLYGQCGHGSADSAVPRLVEAMEDVGIIDPKTGRFSGVATVACGWWHTAAVSTCGDLYTWGWNKYGQLGRNCNGIPGIVRGALNDETVVRVACGARLTSVVTEKGALFMFGTLWIGESVRPLPFADAEGGGDLPAESVAERDGSDGGGLERWHKIPAPRRVELRESTCSAVACGRWHVVAAVS